MNTTTRRTAVLVATGALGLSGLAVAAPALAGMGPFGRPAAMAGAPTPGWRGDGSGMGMNGGMGANGTGMGMHGAMADGAGMGMAGADGCGGLAVTAPKGTLTEGQTTTLAAMAQEEKLAHDLYVAFAARYDATIFDHIAVAETRHLTAVRTLLTRYGIADPTAGRPAGEFNDPAVRATYHRLLTEGQADRAAAIRVGQTVEQGDINALRTALDGLTAPDVRQVYGHLLITSQHHLTAFQRWSTR